MADTDKPEGKSVQPPAVPIKGVNQPDPTTGGEAGDDSPTDGDTGHAAFEKAKAETGQRNA